MIMDGMRPVHPGEILREEFLLPLDITPSALARDLKVTAARINEICQEKRGITADTAYRLATYFNTTPDFWMNLQKDYELHTISNEDVEAIAREIAPRISNNEVELV